MKATILFLVISLSSFQLFSQSIAWTEQTSGVTTQLTSVSVVDFTNAWICGYAGVVLRTTNGGSSWVSVTGAPIPNTLDLHCIYATDANTALVAGSSTSATFVFRTSNGGANWLQVFTQANGFINSILMATPQAGFMMGDPVGGRWSLWGTLTGGLTWDSTSFYLPQNGSDAGWNNSMYLEGNTGISFGTNNTRVYKTTNLVIWTPQTTTGQVNSYAIWFNNLTNGMTGGTGLLFTNNGGATWNPTSTALPGSGNLAAISGTGSFWVVARQTTAIYTSTNDGGAWNTSYTAPAGNYRHISNDRASRTVFYGVRTNGGISRGLIILGITPVSSEIPKAFNLEQNYPNPFNPNTNIRFSISESGFVTLKIYDILGREVSTLVNENLNAGKYDISFDASNLTSGVYYYTLTAGNFVETRKMILSK